MEIAGKPIGESQPVYVIAELSANHRQSFEQALQLVRAAHESGADAVKLQTYTADTLTIASDREAFRIGDDMLWSGRTLHDLYEEAYTPWKWQPRLKEAANNLGMALFSSPFDFSAVDFLEQMQVPAYKIASFELVDLPLIRRVSATGKPIILSTGMAELPEIEEALAAARSHGDAGVALLKCTSAYPAEPEEMNLRTIPHLGATFGVPVGLSDHTLGSAVPVAAVSLGASIVEKHLTLRRSDGGPDSAFSLEPGEFRDMVQAIQNAKRSLGTVRYGAYGRETGSIRFRRSLFVTADVAAGEPLTEQNVRSIRPAGGLPPRDYETILGLRAAKNIERGTPLTWDLLQQRPKHSA